MSSACACPIPHRSLLQATLLACLGLVTLNATATGVWVVTDRAHPVTHVTPDARVIELDAPAQISAELSAGLPVDPVQAAVRVRQRLNDGAAPLRQRLAIAYQGVVDAWRLGVTHYPAVIVDRRYVIYGETDVLRALARIDALRSTTP